MMFTVQENQIIEEIYEAALKPHHWENVLKQVVEFTQSSTAIFTYFDQLRPEQNFIYTINIPIDGIQNYQTYNLDVVDMRIHGELMNTYGLEHAYQIDCRSYAETDNEDLKSFYEYCLVPSNICYLSGVLLEYGKYKWGVLAVHRPSDAVAYEAAELQSLERLAKHFRRAIQIHRQIKFLQNDRSNYTEILDKLNVGVLIVQSDLEVRFVNQYAKDCLNDTSMIEIDLHNRLKIIEPYNAQLKKLVQSTFKKNERYSLERHDQEEVGGAMQLYSDRHQSAYLITVSPLKVLSDSMILDNNQVALFLSKMQDRKRLSKMLLKSTFQLTAREIEICQHFMDDQHLDNIALKCGITLSSLRTYLKTIYQKLGCSSQAEMMRILIEFIDAFQHIE